MNTKAREWADKFPVNEAWGHDKLENVLIDAAGLLDTIKSEWGDEWSEWDQSVRNGITQQLCSLASPETRQEMPTFEQQRETSGVACENEHRAKELAITPAPAGGTDIASYQSPNNPEPVAAQTSGAPPIRVEALEKALQMLLEAVCVWKHRFAADPQLEKVVGTARAQLSALLTQLSASQRNADFLRDSVGECHLMISRNTSEFQLHHDWDATSLPFRLARILIQNAALLAEIERLRGGK